MKIFNKISVCLSSLALTFVLSGSALGAIKFCNNYAQPVFVAMAYKQNYSDSTSSYISRGWLEVDNGKCGEFDTGLHVPFFYYRGETNWYKVKGGRKKNVWGDDANKFITTVASFNYWDADKNTPISGTKTDFVGFVKSIESADGDISETVTFEDDGIHDTQTTGNGDKSQDGEVNH